MADYRGESSSGGGPWLYFLVGALVVAVGVLGYLYFTGGSREGNVNLTVESPAEGTSDGGGPAQNPGDGGAPADR